MLPNHVRDIIGKNITIELNDDIMIEAIEIVKNRKNYIISESATGTAFKNTLRGLILERGFAKAIKGKKNTQPFDYTDPLTYCWDVEDQHNNLYEIKTLMKLPFVYVKNYHLKRVDMRTCLKFVDYVDYVVCGHIKQIRPKLYSCKYLLAADLKTFNQYESVNKVINKNADGDLHEYIFDHYTISMPNIL